MGSFTTPPQPAGRIVDLGGIQSAPSYGPASALFSLYYLSVGTSEVVVASRTLSLSARSTVVYHAYVRVSVGTTTTFTIRIYRDGTLVASASFTNPGAATMADVATQTVEEVDPGTYTIQLRAVSSATTCYIIGGTLFARALTIG